MSPDEECGVVVKDDHDPIEVLSLPLYPRACKPHIRLLETAALSYLLSAPSNQPILQEDFHHLYLEHEPKQFTLHCTQGTGGFFQEIA